MYCANCKSDVAVSNGYCSRCGVSISATLCPKGHVMDSSWNDCHVCSPAPDGGGKKGRTFVENQLPQAAPVVGGFVRGATLLEEQAAHPGGRQTRADPPVAVKSKGRTVFDPGLASGTSGAPLPKLVGWLVTFSHNSSGDDFRLREGRNVIGSDDDCDIVLNHGSVSAKHAVIMFRDGRFQIRDNDSTNGTYVNGEDIFGKGALVIEGGESIRIGDSDCILYPIERQATAH